MKKTPSSRLKGKKKEKLLFRELALALPETAESKHMGHPDFRVAGKIFATLSADETSGCLKLTPQQQAVFVRSEPAVYKPLNGAWGLRGWTRVELAAATEPSLRQALVQAWRNTAPPKVAEQFDDL
jgi:hypothetical protein